MSKNTSIPGWPEQLTPKVPDTPDNPFTVGLASGMEFMKNFWNNAPSAMPGLAVPMIDIGELERRIKELKAVESWLDVNINMLRATIQTLEVQRNTIAMLGAISTSMSGARDNVKEALANAFKTSAPAPGAPAAEAPAPGAHGSDTAAPPAKSGLPPGWPSSAPAQAPAEADAVDKPAPRRGSKKSKKADAKSAPPPAETSFSPNAWLGFLQDQFNKVATTALSSEPPAKESDAAKPAAKTAANKAAKKDAKKPAARKAAAKKTAGDEPKA